MAGPSVPARFTMYTLAPSAAMLRTMPSPMPFVPPVTMTTLSFR